MFILEGIFAGFIATLLFDLYQISLSYAYNINKSRWDLVGRYFLGVSRGVYVQENIENESSEKNELKIGYSIHYIIGIIYGIIYSSLNTLFYDNPSIALALFIGFLTVLGSWCFMMPFVFNIGFFATKKDEQKQIIVQNLLAHFIFGIGLFIGLQISQ